MTKRIILSLVMIALTIAGVTSATVAYFSDSVVNSGNTFSMGTVNVDNAWVSGLPIRLLNLAPGEIRSSGVLGVGYGGTVTADLYVGLRHTSGGDLRSVLEYYIQEVSSDGVPIRNVNSWEPVGNLFEGWKKVADNVQNGNWRYYKVHVKVSGAADNALQGEFVINDIIIYAVQDGQTPGGLPGSYTGTI
jgi:predicted ribosomally synthesized peptide with SipW-like signal peptide